jgi:hypothetical protein
MEIGRAYEGEGGLSYETITSMDGKSHETVCLQWTFHSDEPWRTEVGRVHEGEGGPSYETLTSMDGKSHETFCLQWTFTQMSPGGWRLDEYTRVKEGCLMRPKLFVWKISWNLLFTMNFLSDEPWGTEVGRVYEDQGGLSYETITSMDEKKISWNCLFKINLSLRWALEDGGWTSVQSCVQKKRTAVPSAPRFHILAICNLRTVCHGCWQTGSKAAPIYPFNFIS